MSQKTGQKMLKKSPVTERSPRVLLGQPRFRQACLRLFDLLFSHSLTVTLAGVSGLLRSKGRSSVPEDSAKERREGI